MSEPTEFAIGEGATAAVEALAETCCYIARHPHTAQYPACFDGRRFADRTLAVLSLNRNRASAVGNWLLDRVIKSIAADIERAELDRPVADPLALAAAGAELMALSDEEFAARVTRAGSVPPSDEEPGR